MKNSKIASTIVMGGILLAGAGNSFAQFEILADRPAKSWEGSWSLPSLAEMKSGKVDEKIDSGAYPIGNSRLGGMVFGDPVHEKIQFNEISLWTGGANESGGYDGNGAENFGTYQNFGEVLFDSGVTGEVKGYKRVLDLNTTVVTTTWQQGGVNYKREVFASRPDQVILIRFSADQAGKISGIFRLKSVHNLVTSGNEGGLMFAGALPNQLRYAAVMSGVAKGGKLAVEGDGLKAVGCDRVTMALAANTDYALDEKKKFRSGVDPVEKGKLQVKAALVKNFEQMQKAHVLDYQKLFGRVALDLGVKEKGVDEKPLVERLAAYRAGTPDLGLEEMLFQYGRYLLISSSRDSLPANLQGLWNHFTDPNSAWHRDYHTNINLQMNYWLADPANLSECALPLFRWIEESIPNSRAATQKQWGKDVPGWTMRTSVNAFGGNGWDWNVPASAWLARHFFEHYLFTQDRVFLEKRVWPILRDVSAFQLSELTEKDGKLLVKQGWSPEHGPREDGVTHDQQIAWDLFSNTLKTSDVLGKVNDELVVKVKVAREKLLGPKIGTWGQIMEWTTERPELEKSGHRHTSHLYAVYPGNQINGVDTPDLLKAAETSLLARGSDGDSRRSWTWAWRSALWARMGNGEKVGEMVNGLLVHNTLANLFATHPPFQIDGNLGITAGMCEALLQSQAGECSLLPAIPKKWETGSFRGLCARGGFVFDAKWEGGRVRNVRILSKVGSPLVLRLPGNPLQITLKKGNGSRRVVVKANAKGVFEFSTKVGDVYHVSL